jgi:hypothetical protein
MAAQPVWWLAPIPAPLSDGAPLALAEIRSPFLPGNVLVPGLIESNAFAADHDWPPRIFPVR